MTRVNSADLSVYLVTDAALSGDRGVESVVAEAVAGGVRMVQLREKHASDAEVVEQLARLADVIDGRALLVVDDRLDAAVEARRRGVRVDGVHVGQSDVSVVEARRVLGEDAIVGLTANQPAHFEALHELPVGTVDYVGVGVIRPTKTKANHPPALGVEGFAERIAASPVPAVAIGGVRVDDVAALRAAGAAGVAVVSAICAADDPRAATAEFVRAWHGERPPRVLSVAGSDPSGGAGIQADLKSIAAKGGYGMAAVTALTAQNTRGVRAVHTPPAGFLRAQLDALSDDVDIDAVKVGMLADADVTREVGAWLTAARPAIVVLDPVMIATSGDRLLAPEAEEALQELLPLADLLTPNLPELAVLTGESLATDWATALHQAQQLAAATGARVFAKGGHLPGEQTPDALVGAHGVIAEFPGARINTRHTHGTGCSLSSALATRAAVARASQPQPDDDAVWRTAAEEARGWLRESIRAGEDLDVGRGNGPIDHFAGLRRDAALARENAEGQASGAVAPAASSAAVTAEQVAEEWWARIEEIRGDIDDLPFIRALADGTLDQERFLFYLAQDALYLREYARVLAAASMVAPTSQEQAFWAQGAQGSIAGELELHASWLTPEQGIVEGTFAAVPAPATVAYLDHLRAAAFDGRYEVLVAAVLPCYWLYTDLGVRLEAGDFGAWAQDPKHPYASWLATYSDPAFAESNRQAIEYTMRAAANADPAMRARMFTAFERSAGHELAFFAAPGV